MAVEIHTKFPKKDAPFFDAQFWDKECVVFWADTVGYHSLNDRRLEDFPGDSELRGE